MFESENALFNGRNILVSRAMIIYKTNGSTFSPALFFFPRSCLRLPLLSTGKPRPSWEQEPWELSRWGWAVRELPSTGASLEGFTSVWLSLACGVQMSPDWLSFELALTIQFFQLCIIANFLQFVFWGAGGWKAASFSQLRGSRPPQKGSACIDCLGKDLKRPWSGP